MNRVFCSTGTSIGRPNGRDFRLLSRCAENLICDGFEFMMYESWYDKVDELLAFLKQLPMAIPVVHVEKLVGERISRNEPGDTESALEMFEINCRVAESVGAKLLVLHLWNGPHSDKDIEHNIRVYGRLRPIAEKYGLLLTVENVVCANADPMTHMRRMIEVCPDISFTFDTKMAAFHSQLDELYLPENREIVRRIRHMHVNDYKGGYKDWSSLKTLHPGQGQIDFEKFFDFVRETGYQGDFTVEATSLSPEGVIDFDSLNRSLAFVKNHIVG